MLGKLWAKADGWKTVAGAVLSVVAAGLAATGRPDAAKVVATIGAIVLGTGVTHKAVKAKKE